MAVGGSVTGEIDYGGDRDWFAVTLDAGQTYRFDLEGARTRDGTLYNPYLRGIYDANGHLIAGTTDNNGGVGLNSQVDFTPTANATYYVAVGAAGTGEGTYTLSVRNFHPDDFGQTPGTSGAVEVDGSVTGEIDYCGRPRLVRGDRGGGQRSTGSTSGVRMIPETSPSVTRICTGSTTRMAASSPARRTTTAAMGHKQPGVRSRGGCRHLLCGCRLH